MRSIFYVSDNTAITAKSLGQSLITQFTNLDYTEFLRPYINNEEKILLLIHEIKDHQKKYHKTPVVFASIMSDALMNILISKVEGVIDIFRPFAQQLGDLMDEQPSKAVGKAHDLKARADYRARMAAIDFTMATDDGLRVDDYDHADVILLGVSRSGKTPTAIYLALNFSLKVANYPFTADDLPTFTLNQAQIRNRHKLFGLMVDEKRLSSIRKERRSNSSYSDLLLIKKELLALKKLFVREDIDFIDTTNKSVEEIAALIMNKIFYKR